MESHKAMNVRSEEKHPVHPGLEVLKGREIATCLTYAINAFDLEPFQGTSPGR